MRGVVTRSYFLECPVPDVEFQWLVCLWVAERYFLRCPRAASVSGSAAGSCLYGTAPSVFSESCYVLDEGSFSWISLGAFRRWAVPSLWLLKVALGLLSWDHMGAFGVLWCGGFIVSVSGLLQRALFRGCVSGFGPCELFRASFTFRW